MLLLLLGASVAVDRVLPRELYQVCSSPWFVALSLLFLASLSLSTYDQLRRVVARLAKTSALAARRGAAADPHGLIAELARRGYRRVSDDATACRYVRARWGYLGSALLHLGITATVAFSFVYVLTENRIIVRAVEGERVALEDAVLSRRQGLLPAAARLPRSVTLDRLTPAFWRSDQLKSLSSSLTLGHPASAQPERLEIGINEKGSYRGLSIYQQGAFGRVFLVELASAERGRLRKAMPLPMPPSRTRAAYGDFVLEGSPYRLRAKFYASADRSGMLSGPPLLVLRLMRGAEVIGQAELAAGASVRLGPYTVRSLASRWWADFLFDGSRGTFGIFAGFILLSCGGLLSFFVVPREVVVRTADGGYRVSWHAPRFPELYREEREAILALAGTPAEGGR